ncbi:MAG: GAF domain-containing protein [Rhodocyclaceae bacterium]|nr:GAF domain-containing protein [Rhodocyclaceae bacterium]
MKIRLEAIRDCLEGVIPGSIATASADGTPNIAYLSQVQYVDGEHVALSYQFFSSTRRNVLANSLARLALIDPFTAAHYRLTLQYLRTETEGALFEGMKAKLAGIASHTGMAGVFRLLGSDIYRVLDIEQVPGRTLPPRKARRNPLLALRRCSEALRDCADLECLLAEALAALAHHFDIEHAMVLVPDALHEALYTVASRGYQSSGVGSEIPFGHGVIGVAARERAPIRIGHFSSEYAYGRAIRASLSASGQGDRLETEIPLPGLQDVRSQLAVPICAGGRLLGVLCVESGQDLAFDYDDEDVLVALAGQLGATMLLLQHGADGPEEAVRGRAAVATAGGRPLVVRHFDENDSIFLGEDYLIKGVAGSILWAMLRDHADSGRVTFSNRELRLDPRIRLPELGDNLEARLILLRRRLEERAAGVRIERAGRGRIRLCVERSLQLQDVPRQRPNSFTRS